MGGRAVDLPPGFELCAFVYGWILEQKAEGRRQEERFAKGAFNQSRAILFSRICSLPTAYCLLLAVFRRLDSPALRHNGLVARCLFSRSASWLGRGQRGNPAQDDRWWPDVEQNSSPDRRHCA